MDAMRLMDLFKPHYGDQSLVTVQSFGKKETKFAIEGFVTSKDVREQVFKALRIVNEKGKFYCLTNNTPTLDEDHLLCPYFDLDITVPIAEAAPVALEATISRLVDCMYGVLYEYSDMPQEQELRIIVLQKPEPTAKGDGKVKIGFKIVIPNLQATRTQIRQLCAVLEQRYDAWNHPTWPRNIIDESVYKGSGWCIYGSRKADQKAGGYEVSRVYYHQGESAEEAQTAARDYLTDKSFIDRSHDLCLFPDPDAEVHTLSFTKEAPYVQPHGSKKRASSSASGSSKRHCIDTGDDNEAVFNVLRSIIKDATGDSSSTVDRLSRKLNGDIISYRFSRRGDSNCINKGITHSSNGFSMRLNTVNDKVFYACLSEECGAGKKPVNIECINQAQQWAALENIEFPFEGASDDEEMAAARAAAVTTAAVVTPTVVTPTAAAAAVARSISGDSSDTTELDAYIDEAMGDVDFDDAAAEQDTVNDLIEGCSIRRPTIEDFNKSHFMLRDGTSYVTVRDDGTVVTYSKQAFTNLYEGYAAVKVSWSKQPVPFIHKWFKSADKRIIDRIAKIPPPLECPPGVFNSWRGFAAAKLEGKANYDETIAQRYLDHVSLLSGHNAAATKFMLDSDAQMLQQPGFVPGVSAVYKSKPGSGKSTKHRAIVKIMGPENAVISNKPKDFFGEFNSLLDGMIYVALDDAKTKDMYEYAQTFLHLITDAQYGTTIRRMHTAPIHNQKVYVRFSIAGQGGVLDDVDDRRFVIYDVSNERVGDLAYGEETDNMFQSLDGQWTIYKLLMDRNIAGVRFNERPSTLSGIEMQRVNIPDYIRLIHLLAEGPFREGDKSDIDRYPMHIQITSDDIYTLYDEFWKKFYSKRDKAQPAIDHRTLSSKIIELSKDVLGHGDNKVGSGIECSTITIGFNVQKSTRIRRRGFTLKRGQVKAYMAKRFHLKSEIETDMMSLNDLPEFDWTELQNRYIV